MKTAVFAVSALALAAGAAIARPPVSVSTAAFTEDGSVVRGPGSQSFDFEAPAYVIGPVNGQSGWAASANSLWGINTANPAGGTQHLRGERDTPVPAGTNRIAFGPNAGALPVGPSSVSFDFNISATGGADYDAVGQAPSQAFLSWRVKFSFTGNIVVLDDVGAGLAFIDTGSDWAPGVYQNLRVDLNPGANTLQYFLNNTLIYTSATGVVAGTTVEQFVVLHDNFQEGDVGDFDNVSVIPAPGALALLGLGGLAAARRRRN